METRTIRVFWCTDEEADIALPELVDIPSDIDDEDVTDFLSDEYGFLVESWYEE